ncbi:antibiotic biosynthesis monooxygenase [Tersicoccus sp. Bi-70]|uniref:antibiotic biosynthesis monooxygenase n=1 Tax=Tersicoccus sp. Bi-70 TaxID=1897634 RepID=UPI0009755D49|nr:antibiotic biosynthesis monooxygenase [Tersicoccus sp. Bi-70]OMH34384.1 antibiotic biosynthesis monooxygenase [Tersicoccus sp. Bi-70]
MSPAVTVSITRVVDPSRPRQVEVWARAGQDLARQFPGYLGSGWIQSHDSAERWHMLYRFSNERTLRVWEESPERRWWMNTAEGMVQHDREQRRTGIEGWFEDPADEIVAEPLRTPPRWKQMISIFIVFFPVSLTLQWLMSPVIGGWVLPLRVLVSTMVAVPLMTYFFLPWSTRVLSPWLHAPQRSKR